MINSGWKFILLLVFDSVSTLRSSSLWRIGTIFLLLEKARNAREPQVRLVPLKSG